MENTELSLKPAQSMQQGPASVAVPGGSANKSPANMWAWVQRGAQVAWPWWRHRELCWEMRRPQGMDRRLLSDLAMLVEGRISPGCGLLPAQTAESGGCHRAGLDFESWGSTPTSCPAGSSIGAAAEGGQGGRWAVPGLLGSG